MIFPNNSMEENGTEEIITRTRLMWRMVLFLPFLYIGVALLIERTFFIPDEKIGFWAIREVNYQRTLMLFVLLAILLQATLQIIRIVFQKKIEAVRLIPVKTAILYWKRTYLMTACADTVCVLGFILFLIRADWRPLIGFCIFSYFLYIQATPRARHLENQGSN